ncbi:hypothetical protein [Microbacterium sp. NPDC076895]|uniref:hypothetical protein n=1 Tax=Microbacterium sp. NPDC076895 TaxID=3154957 RepID=UPI00343D8746
MLSRRAIPLRAWPVVVLALATGVAVSGCSPDGDAVPTPAETSSAVVLEIATVDGSQLDGHDLALNSGTLVAVGNCVALDNGTVLVFPDGEASWDGETLRFGGEEFHLGDVVSSGGSPLAEQFASMIPSGCADLEPWGVGTLELGGS